MKRGKTVVPNKFKQKCIKEWYKAKGKGISQKEYLQTINVKQSTFATWLQREDIIMASDPEAVYQPRPISKEQEVVETCLK